MTVQFGTHDYWLITSTTYGTWLPGDRRGFVGPVRDAFGQQRVNNVPGTPFDRNVPSLQAKAKTLLKCPPVALDETQAQILLTQFQDTAAYRRWLFVAAAIMTNHFHVVVAANDGTRSSSILRDLKSYGSRALSQRWSKPASDTWWTKSGSRRRLPNETAVQRAIQYVKHQPNSLVVWINEETSI